MLQVEVSYLKTIEYFEQFDLVIVCTINSYMFYVDQNKYTLIHTLTLFTPLYTLLGSPSTTSSSLKPKSTTSPSI